MCKIGTKCKATFICINLHRSCLLILLKEMSHLIVLKKTKHRLKTFHCQTDYESISG